MTVANELIAQLKVYKEGKKALRWIMDEEKNSHTTEFSAEKLGARFSPSIKLQSSTIYRKQWYEIQKKERIE